MKVLVTGGLGFIGQSVVRNLLARGIATVSADASGDAETIASLRALARGGSGFDAVAMDVSDFRDVMAVFHKHPDISHAIHLAYVVGPLVDENSSLSTRVNILGMTNLFEAAVHRKFARLVFTSSETVYGPSQAPFGDRPVTEDDFCNPATHSFTYGVMKLLNEHMGRRYVERLGANIVCTRPPVVFGHGRKRSAVMWAEHFASKPAVGEPVTLPFAPETRDTWIYKDDCAEQLIRLALKPKLSYFAYNNGGACVSAAELAAVVKKWIPDARISFSAGGTPLIDNQDGTRLAREIDFVPRPLAEGVRAQINEARSAASLPPI
ncbi:MAG TPA: NAD(P)-dependent oxidoreductase [Terriglobales bacterium]|nr:NAD(P)-dependent oxidoreductase [Terriglobales bacterium]